LNQLRMPGFSETNLFDATFDTLDRIDRIEGKKYIILVTTGVDTFSKLTLDQPSRRSSPPRTSRFTRSASALWRANIARYTIARRADSYTPTPWITCKRTMR